MPGSGSHHACILFRSVAGCVNDRNWRGWLATLEVPGATELRTETRVLCGDVATRRRFRVYWMLISIQWPDTAEDAGRGCPEGVRVCRGLEPWLILPYRVDSLPSGCLSLSQGLEWTRRSRASTCRSRVAGAGRRRLDAPFRTRCVPDWLDEISEELLTSDGRGIDARFARDRGFCF